MHSAPNRGSSWGAGEGVTYCEPFETLLEAQVLVARWRTHYSQVRPHSSPGYRLPAPEAVLIGDQRLGSPHWRTTG